LVKIPFHSKPPSRRANRRRKLALTPAYISNPDCWQRQTYNPHNSVPTRRILRPALVLLTAFLAQVGTAQQIAVKLVDGRNGRALKDQAVAIWLGEKAVGMPGQTIPTNADGIALVPIPIQQSSFVIGGESLVDCRMRVRYGKVVDEGKTEWVYRFADVLAHGAVGANKCGKATVQPIPGQLVLFVRTPHWWEKVLWE
jgi:hypothetical protein